MKKNNLVEILKNCPKGMELDCTMFDGLEFDHINTASCYPIQCRVKRSGSEYIIYAFDKYGHWNDYFNAKCVIFPKGKTTWEGFVPPCQFKDEDILADEHGNIAIYKGTMWYNKKLADYYCGYRKSDNKFLIKTEKDGHFGFIEELHYASEEEKEKLFQLIKENGYKWNAETKTLETLVKPKFKVGDEVRGKYTNNIYTISRITSTGYELTNGQFFTFNTEYCYELILDKFDITTFKPFDKVLVRDGNYGRWKIQFFEKFDKELKYPFICMDGRYSLCIPYSGNEHLHDTTTPCSDYYLI